MQTEAPRLVPSLGFSGMAWTSASLAGSNTGSVLKVPTSSPALPVTSFPTGASSVQQQLMQQMIQLLAESGSSQMQTQEVRFQQQLEQLNSMGFMKGQTSGPDHHRRGHQSRYQETPGFSGLVTSQPWSSCLSLPLMPAFGSSINQTLCGSSLLLCLYPLSSPDSRVTLEVWAPAP